MKCYRKVLGAKIHRATVTKADLHYEGSITLPPELLKAANIHNYEHVHIWNITSGTRFETYAIAGLPSSTDVCVNGAAAHLANPGDLVIIANFIDIKEKNISEHKPRLIFVDEQNKITEQRDELPGPHNTKSTVNT